MFEKVTESADETRSIAAEIGRVSLAGDVILLTGELGTGKTTFVQGLADGLGVSEAVTSPTFTLVHEYLSGRLTLIHVDPYRLETEREIVELGFDDWIDRDAVLVIEWGERLGGLTPSGHLAVAIETLPDDRRRISMQPVGNRWLDALTGSVPITC